MFKYLIILVLFYSSENSFAQSNESDLIRKSDFYKDNCKGQTKTKCKELGGTSIELRICLIFEFLEIDSILYVLNLQYIDMLDVDDSLEWNHLHNDWLSVRKKQAVFFSKDFSGHEGVILYLDSLIVSTRQRIDFLEYIKEFR